MMSFTEAVKTCYRKSMIIEGRASRSEFWWFYAYVVALGFFCATLLGDIVYLEQPVLLILLFFILLLTSTLPLFCVAVRRWHDLGKSGWYMLLLIIYPIGLPVTLIYFCMDSVKTDNMDGDRPVVFDPARSTAYRPRTMPPIAPPVPPVAPPVQQTVYQTVVHGDYIDDRDTTYVDDRDTIVKDSVISKSNVGAGGKSKAEQVQNIKELLDSGAIDEKEYKQMKKEILGK